MKYPCASDSRLASRMLLYDIKYSSASIGASQEIAKGTKLGKALSKCDNKSAISIYAMSKGYNVISNGMGYLNVLNRNAITVSSNITPM